MSDCLRGRKHHSWRTRKTRGPLDPNNQEHRLIRCRWCGKFYFEALAEQKMKRGKARKKIERFI